jgi:type VI secretion system protein ImpF
MARTELERTVRQPLLDRLIDLDPAATADAPTTLGQSARAFKGAVQRDLEWLLNTRRTAEPIPEQLSELARSVHAFGLPDISSMSRDAHDSKLRLLRHVEKALGEFEPRLARIRVSMVEDETDNARRELRFVIQGTLRMDPNPEQVVFDTILEISSGEYEVTGGSGA